MKKLVYAGSPHIRGKATTKSIMIDVCIALLPSAIVGCVFFGWKAVLTILIAVVAAVVSELVYVTLYKKSFQAFVKQFDFSSVVTGLLIGMNMPSTVPWYVPLIASMFGIVVVKMLFGGTGSNLVNPAIAARVFVFLSFGAVSAGWVVPNVSSSGITQSILTGATPLTQLLTEGLSGLTTQTSLLNMFLGLTAGCIGEVCALALIVGGIYLVIRRVINPLWPLIYIAVTGLMVVALKGFNFEYFLPSILSGGLMLGAIFMATDYVTTPTTFVGNLVYFILLGIVTGILRVTTQIEVVSFAILFMNLFVPIIDKYIVNKPFGAVKAVKAVKEAK